MLRAPFGNPLEWAKAEAWKQSQLLRRGIGVDGSPKGHPLAAVQLPRELFFRR